MEPSEYDLMASLEDTMWWYRGLHAELLSRLERSHLAPGARVLDAGCGTGGFLRRLAATRPDLSLEGLELDERAAAMAREKTGLAVTVGSVDRMPYASGSFAAIVSADVLYHAGLDERVALGEFHRCLSARGFLLLNLPAFKWLFSAHDRRVHAARRYHAADAARLVLAAGFSDVRVNYWNGLLFPLMMVHRLLLRRASGVSDVRQYPPWQNRLLLAVLAGEHRLSSTGFRMPFGGSVQVEARK